MARGRVGIIGGYGRVGVHVARQLVSRGFEVVVAGRSLDRAHALAETFGDFASARQVDIEDRAGLVQLAKSVDVVVNAAGPAMITGDRVARAALEARAHYVDPGGYDPLCASLERLRIDRTFVINAGLLPGLSGVLPLALLREAALDRIDRLTCFYVGRDRWSLSSAYDIAASLGDFGQDHGPVYLDGGKIRRVSIWSAFKRVRFPAPIGAVTTFLLHHDELSRIANAHHVPLAFAYGANNSRFAGMMIALIKVAKLHRTEAQRARSARWIARAAELDGARQEPCFGVHAIVEGMKNGAPVRKTATWMTGDTYRATGTIAGITAELILEGAIARRGAMMLHEAVEPSLFFAHVEGRTEVRDVAASAA